MPGGLRWSLRYPQEFFQKGEKVMVIGTDGRLEVIPLRYVLEKIGSFKEPLI